MIYTLPYSNTKIKRKETDYYNLWSELNMQNKTLLRWRLLGLGVFYKKKRGDFIKTKKREN